MNHLARLFDLVLQNEIQSFVYEQSILQSSRQFQGVILSGSFNPFHSGHRHLLETAKSITHMSGAYELSIKNADKTSIECEVLKHRLAQFSINDTVIVTKAPFFVRKSMLFPGSIFVLGIDTVIRLLNPKYYGGEILQRNIMLGDVAKNNCRFLVAGRVIEGSFKTLSDVQIPSQYKNLFEQIPESTFREDISSSELRSK